MQNPHKKLKTQSAPLPIANYRQQIRQLVKTNRVVVISGQTGSGKTTQLPQYLYDSFQSICISQPRRISAITLSKRVSEEMGVTLGEQVGYSVRFEEVRGEKTKIHFVTDGMAIREMMLGKRYDLFVLDEAHQRSVNTDVLIALLKRNLQTNKKLKLVIMSATIDISKFLKFFDSDAYLSIQGRTFPIHLYYTLEPVADYTRACVDTIMQIHDKQPVGDILVFLTGQQQILQAQKQLKQKINQATDRKYQQLTVRTLYSALPSEIQMLAFQKTIVGQRKVILSTNIAETSVTVDGIKYVVDCGHSKIRVFDHERNMEILAVVPVSKANALQRAGRAGRQSQGKCYRLYVKNSYEQLPDYHLPEILRVDVSGSLLQLKCMGVSAIRQFEFLDPPSEESMNHSVQLLFDVGAIDKLEKVTEKGLELGELPLVPELSNLLLTSAEKEYDCADVMLSCLAILTAENIFFTLEKHNLLKVMKRYEVHQSDHLTKVNIFHEFLRCTNRKSFAKENHLNTKNISRAVEIRQQLRDYLIDILVKRHKKNPFQKVPADTFKEGLDKTMEIGELSRAKEEKFRKCMAKAAVRRCAKLDHHGSYIINHTNEVAKIHPESICFMAKPMPEYIVFNELIKTHKTYLRDITRIEAISK